MEEIDLADYIQARSIVSAMESRAVMPKEPVIASAPTMPRSGAPQAATIDKGNGAYITPQKKTPPAKPKGLSSMSLPFMCLLYLRQRDRACLEGVDATLPPVAINVLTGGLSEEE